ncbi:MAG TPA: phosphate ABC transporter ATP-binding protein [Hyphomicrobiales bacterium]|nr:phosphate ABC transporter ATP-binding protein [Hyphomicrobiales bacterium]
MTRHGAVSALLPLVVEDLVFEAGGRRLIDGIDLTLEAGRRSVILGPNGSGKSLFLRLIHGLIPPTSGRIAWNGRPPGREVRLSQAMVFQQPVLLRRSVAANIDYALAAHGFDKAARRARTEQMLIEAGLEHLARQPARRLSGGEQQRLALARALAVEPDVLLLDEPTSSLDPHATLRIEMLIARAAQEGVRIVLVTHDIGQARRFADEVVFLHRGRIAEHAPAEVFFDEPGSEAARSFLAGELVL